MAIEAESQDAERDAATAGRRFGRAFADGADREVSRANLSERLRVSAIENLNGASELLRRGLAMIELIYESCPPPNTVTAETR